jgi:hypothetical protein
LRAGLSLFTSCREEFFSETQKTLRHKRGPERQTTQRLKGLISFPTNHAARSAPTIPPIREPLGPATTAPEITPRVKPKMELNTISAM